MKIGCRLGFETFSVLACISICVPTHIQAHASVNIRKHMSFLYPKMITELLLTEQLGKILTVVPLKFVN